MESRQQLEEACDLKRVLVESKEDRDKADRDQYAALPKETNGADTRDATDRRGLTTGPGRWDAPRARRRLWAFARGVTNNVRPATVT